MDIIFTDLVGVPEDYLPEPARSVIPNWYKDMDSYLNKEKKPVGEGHVETTIKRCMPVFDAITAGYIIKSYVDVYVSQNEATQVSRSTGKSKKIKSPGYQWPSHKPIEFHPNEQAPDHPMANKFMYPKWMNPWGIKTPPGYSCLFIQPVHRESVFTILPGVVDTDNYYAPVNFPFVLNDTSYEGLIPAGTPIAQVIPFKRDPWELKFGGHDEVHENQRILTRLRSTFFDGYKSKFRQEKDYR
jgi:hypothetical protein